MDNFFIEQNVKDTPLDTLRDDLGIYLKVSRRIYFALFIQKRSITLKLKHLVAVQLCTKTNLNIVFNRNKLLFICVLISNLYLEKRTLDEFLYCWLQKYFRY